MLSIFTFSCTCSFLSFFTYALEKTLLGSCSVVANGTSVDPATSPAERDSSSRPRIDVGVRRRTFFAARPCLQVDLIIFAAVEQRLHALTWMHGAVDEYRKTSNGSPPSSHAPHAIAHMEA